MNIYGAQSLHLPDGYYVVKRHEVRRTVTYANTLNAVVWGRGAATNGWADEGNYNFTYGWCEPVPGTVTSTSAILWTYVYEVLSGPFLGWYPTTPGNVRFEYTVHGTGPLSVSISGPSDIYHPEKGYPPEVYTWNAVVSGGSAPYTYTWFWNGNQVGTATSI